MLSASRAHRAGLDRTLRRLITVLTIGGGYAETMRALANAQDTLAAAGMEDADLSPAAQALRGLFALDAYAVASDTTTRDIALGWALSAHDHLKGMTHERDASGEAVPLQE
jgi:hypothetical protein